MVAWRYITSIIAVGILAGIFAAGLAAGQETPVPDQAQAVTAADTLRITAPPGETTSGMSMLLSGMTFEDKDFRKGSSARGLVHKQATVCRNRKQGQAAFAIDASSKSSSTPDCIRIDLQGKGDFTNAPAAKLTSTGNPLVKSIPNQKVNVTIDGMDAEMSISGQYYDYRRHNGPRILQLRLLSALQGNCRIADAEYTVAILDGNNNFEYDDTGSNCDLLCVYANDAEGQQKLLGWTTLGQPFSLGDKFYNITCDRQANSITAEAAEIKSGQISLDCDEWTLLLAKGRDKIVANGTREPACLPIGTYQIYGYSLHSGNYYVNNQNPGKARFKIQDTSRPVEADILPLKPLVSARRGRGKVDFSFSMTDASGNTIAVTNSQGGRIRPGMEVLDDQGKVIYKAQFEFG